MATLSPLEEFLKQIPPGMELDKGDMVFKDQSTGKKVKITVQDDKKKSLFPFGKKKNMKKVNERMQITSPQRDFTFSCSPGSDDSSPTYAIPYEETYQETYENLTDIFHVYNSNAILPPHPPTPLPVSHCSRDATISSSPVSDDSSPSGEDDYQRETELYYNTLRRRSSSKGTRPPDPLPPPPLSARPVPAPRLNKNKPKSVLNDSESDICGSMCTDILSIAEIK